MQDSSPYCGYPPNYWYPPPPAGPYTNAYPSGADMNGQAPYNPQAMPTYPNGVYNPAHYPPPGVLHYPSNPFYCSEQIPPRQPQYHSQDRSTASSPQPPYPVPHCQGAPGYPPGSYPPPYGEVCPSNAPYPSQQPVPSRPQPEPWPHSAGYGPQAHYPNHTRPPHPPPWHGPAPPPYDHIKHKEPPYPGPMNPRTQPKPRPSTPNSNPALKPTEFSAPPQMYNKTSSGSGAGGGAQAKPSPPPPTPTPQPVTSSDNPGLARVQEVLARVDLLQEDVDEFVGRKTDKSYRCLEELLTKELLVLDSVETHGQDAVRSARKEAVQKIQAILDHLERKAF